MPFLRRYYPDQVQRSGLTPLSTPNGVPVARAQYTPSPYSHASDTTIRTYDQVRPRYPREVIEQIWRYLQENTGFAENSMSAGVRVQSASCKIEVANEIHAVDMGAGTGIFTGQLLDLASNLRVSAVEPAANMRQKIAQNHAFAIQNGRLEIVNALAENTKLASGSTDLVAFAQSFHWMKQEEVLAEAARLLRPGGLLVVVANQMDVNRAWVHRLTRIMRSGDVLSPEKGPQFSHPRPQNRVSWQELPFFEVAWTQELTVDQVLELGRTRSSYLRQSAVGQAKMQANLRWYLLEHLGFCKLDTVRLPYRTFLWAAIRLPV